MDLTNTIVFSAGCHSGYNLVDGEALPGVTLPLDWAQAFAQKKAILIGGTGYQYGDTDFLEYSERLYRDFARQLRAGPTGTAVSVGEALAHAKRAYLATTPDIRGIHEKALLEATLFGLPMLGVEMEFGRGAVPGFTGSVTPTSVGGALDGFGLATADLPVTTPLTTPTPLALDVIESGGVTGTTNAQWLVGPDGVVTNPAEPAIPKNVRNVTSTNASQVLRGVGWRGGDYTDASNILPLTGAPTTELRGVHAPFVSPVFYPMKLWTPNYFGALDGSGGTNLIVTPVQHKSDPANPGKTVRRVFNDLDLRLFYSSNLGQVALSDAPTIVKVTSELDGNGDLVFRAQVVGDPKAAMHEVWIVWTNGNGTWQPLDLEQTTEDSRIWTGVLANPVGTIQYVAQAVNGVGLVAFDDNLGRYYSAAGAQPAVQTFTSFVGTVPSSGQHGASVSITAKLTTGSPTGPALAGKPVTISVGGGSGQQKVTDGSGLVTVSVPLSGQPGSTQLVASFGGDQGHLASSVSQPFTINPGTASLILSLPASTLIGGSATATATLTGAGAPLSDTSVAFIVTAPNGTKTLHEVKTDFAGRASLVLPTAVVGPYTIEARFGSLVTVGTLTLDLRSPIYGSASDLEQHLVIWPFTGFFSPVDNPGTTGVVNTVKAGSTVPFKFALGGNRGLTILAQGYPKPVKYNCTSGTPEDAIEETSTASNGLVYNAATGEYQYNWKTPKNYTGSCYRFDIKLIDGTTYSANFKFK